MKISELAINRPIFATMVVSALVVFGAISYRAIGVSLFPDVDFPVVTVTVTLEGADPATVETEMTDPIEAAVNTIGGLKSLRSESAEGIAQVFVEFELDRDIDVAAQDVRDKIASIRADLPDGIDPPIVEKFDPDSAPILAVVLAGPASVRELTEYADDVLKPRIEGIDGVGSVRLVGGRDREIRVWLRGEDLHAYGVTAQDVIDALEKENVEFPGGRLERDSREVIVKTKGEVETVAQFGELIVAYRSHTPVRLRDVALVEDGMEDLRSLSRLDGERAISLLVRRQSGMNLLAVATDVKAELREVMQALPPGYEIVLAQDLSTFVAQNLDEAQGELLRGGCLAVLVILLFLRSLRGAFVAAITIPTTIVSTYSFMQAMGFTLNMMSMLALSISVGMIIDDSIVVLENSHRHLERGKSRRQAALAGIGEIGFAVVATSLAIVAVFVPVAFMEGLVGRFFYEFGLTVTFAVAVSTFIALTLSPMLCSLVLRVSQPRERGLGAFLDALFLRLETGYRSTLRYALRHRALVMSVGTAVFAGSFSLAAFIGKEFVPAQDESQFNVQVQAPLDSSTEGTGRIMEELERRVRHLPHVRNLYTTIGGGAQGRVNNATLMVRLDELSDRDLGQHEIMAMARERLADLSHLKISVEYIPRVSGGGFRASPIQYNLRGSDLDQLDALATELMKGMSAVPGIQDINSTYDVTKPEIAVRVDRDRAADLGIDLETLGRAINALIGGKEVTTFEEDGESYDVRLRLVEAGREDPASIYALPVRARSGRLVDLHSMIQVEETTGPVQIDREDRQRQITVLANLDQSKPLAAAMEDIERIKSKLEFPASVATSFTGFGDLMEESFASIQFSLFLAIVLIYMILASQFESLIHPLTIMLSMPLSIAGALGGLALTGRTLNIFSMIGMIMLMGLVTKNAILLVDYTRQLRLQGFGKDEAILTAGPVRLRPILMTACSTIAGMIPIAIGIGAGAETRGPMGVCVVGGLVTSTLLTLIVIPVMYSLVDDAGRWVLRLTRARAEERQSETHRLLPAEAVGYGPDADAPHSAGTVSAETDDRQETESPVPMSAADTAPGAEEHAESPVEEPRGSEGATEALDVSGASPRSR